jgi:O-antigen/teichoic acid export membrane protein
MIRQLRERLDSLWLMGGVGVRSVAQWAIVLVIGAHEGPSAVGLLAFALAVSSPIFQFFDFALRNIFVTLSERVRFATFARLRVALSAGAAALTTLLALTPSGPDFTIVVAVVVAKFADSLLDMLYASPQRRGKIRSLGLAMSANGIAVIASFAVLYWTSGSVVLGIWGWALASAACAAVLAVDVWRTESTADALLPPGGARSLLRAGLASGLAQSVVSTITYLPVLFLSVLGTPREVGVLTVCAYFVTFASLVLGSLQQATLPAVASRLRAGVEEPFAIARSSLMPFGVVGWAIAAATAVFGNPLLRSLYGDAHAPGLAVLLPIACAIGLLPAVNMSSVILLVTNRYRVQALVALLALVFAIMVGFALVRGFDIVAASWLLFAGIFARSVLGAICSARAMRAWAPAVSSAQ